MWIFHPLGFCSVVADAERPGNLLCRGRVRGDLERLFPEYTVTTTPGRDYRFRVSLPRVVVAVRVAEAVEAISYGNFKDACPKDRHVPYLRVWTVMHELQRDRGPRRAPTTKRRKRIRTADILTDADYYEWLSAVHAEPEWR